MSLFRDVQQLKNFEFFFNSLKLTIKNFSKFFSMNSGVKNFENFLQSISLKKKFDIFSENSKKNNFCHKNKKGTQEGGGNPKIFPRKIRHDLSLGSDVRLGLLGLLKRCAVEFESSNWASHLWKNLLFYLKNNTTKIYIWLGLRLNSMSAAGKNFFLWTSKLR